MEDEKTRKLVDSLAELTNQEKLKWAETENEEAFSLALRENTIIIERRLDSENPAFNYFINISNINGKMLTSLTVLHQTFLWDQINSLFYAAKDNALNVEAVIDKILAELENAKFGF